MSRQRLRKRMQRTRETILDEQEQDEIVAALVRQNHSSSKTYRFIGAILCLVPTVLTAHLMTRHSLLFSLLSISSLVMTAFTLYFLPADEFDGLEGPLARFLLPLNGLLASVITCLVWIKADKHDDGFYSTDTSIHIIPLVMYILAVTIQYSARATSRAIQALERKRYALKGV